MIYYKFTARSPTNKFIKGKRLASTINVIKDKLNKKGYELLDYKIIQRKPLFIRPLNDTELEEFTSNIYFGINAGMTITESLKIILSTSRNKLLSYVLTNVISDITCGKNLKESFIKYINIMTEYFVVMMGLIESSGKTKEIIEEMKDYYKSKTIVTKQVKKALLYPTIISCFVVFVFFLLMKEVIPNYENIFIEMNVEVPKYTKFIIKLSQFIRINEMNILGISSFIIVFLIFFLKLKIGKNISNFMKYKVSILKKIRLEIVAYNFSKTCYLLLSNGQSLKDSLYNLERLETNLIIKKVYQQIILQIEKGKSFSYSTRSVNFFPSHFLEIVDTSESEGNIVSGFKLLAGSYKQETIEKIERLSVLIEPISIIVLAILVIAIVAAIYIPMFSMFDGIMQ